MKASTSSLLLVAVLSAALVRPMFAGSDSNQAKAYAVGSVVRYGEPVVQLGDTALKVVCYLGSPDKRLFGDTWVYNRFETAPGQATSEGCTTLIITFSHDRVTALQQVNEPAVKMIAAKLADPASPTLVASARK